MKPAQCTLFSGAAKGAESEFGAQAEKAGVEEVNFSFEGHPVKRKRGLRFLTHEELMEGDVSLSYVSKLMNRSYNSGPLFKKVMQSIWHQISSAEEVFVVGIILDDNTVKGGTGWGVELAKLFNRKVSVFDQDKEHWFTWDAGAWQKSQPTLPNGPFAATGTRNLSDAGKAAIIELFEQSFGPSTS